MPINVAIDVNGRPIRSLRIGRLTGDAFPESINEYLVYETPVADSDGTSARPLVETHLFTHRYGDGLDMCVQRALTALTQQPQAPLTDSHSTERQEPRERLALYTRVHALRRSITNDELGTHYEGCWQLHPGCALALAADLVLGDVPEPA